jgi:RimJ/RimL family protein N-acetyltransferase
MSVAGLPVLKGGRVTLRRPREEDVEARFKLGADAEIFRMYGGNRSDLLPITEETARRWVQRLVDHHYAWIIEADVLIGHISLDHVDLQDRHASMAIGIEDGTQLGKGLGTEAITLVLGWAFDALKLHRISLRVLEYNVRAIRAYRKCGFSIKAENGSPRSSTASGMTM